MKENDSDYQHGYTSGVENLNREAYEGYLSSQVSHEWVTERLGEKKRDLGMLEVTRQVTLGKRKEAFDRLQTHLLGVHETSKRAREIQERVTETEQETAQLTEKRNAAATHYSLLAGFIFLVAGLSFLFGDLIISHEIVAYALNIRNSNEAWAFAVGLAMVSILLKPAYDRLIEGPYRTDDSPRIQKRYGRFKVALSVFAVGTLLILLVSLRSLPHR